MTRVLDRLSVQEEPLKIGPIRQLTVDDVQDVPSIRTTYNAEVLIVHASSALRRIIALAYMLVWSWSKHVSAADQFGLDRARRVILLFDEVDAHLHPRWQRTILPAILEVMNSLTTDKEEAVPVQILATTHSPLVLASVEPHFDEDRDRLFAPIPLLGHRHDGGIDDLATTGCQTLLLKVGVKRLKEFFAYACLSELFSEQCHCGCIRNGMDHTQTRKLLKRTAIIHLEFHFLITQVV